MNRRRVLIETSWNVKTGTLFSMNLVAFSINRNIVECKDRRYCRSYLSGYVLIETSWNVKDTETSKNILGESVLIETSWNVKMRGIRTMSERRL